MKASFEEFVKEVEKKARRRKPVRTRADLRGTLYAQRNARVAIREAALRGVTCIILYRKATTNELKRYEVIPTEYAYRRTKTGIQKLLWVQDVRDRNDKRQIKSFLVRGVKRVALTDRHLKPKWPILIS